MADQRFHEISGGESEIKGGGFTRRFPEISPEICNQALQIGPEITCNRDIETDPTRYEWVRDTRSERGHIYREGLDTSLSYISPLASLGENRPTYRQVIDAAIARFPRVCPECQSDDIAPMFDPDANWFDCSACGWVFEVRP